MCSSDELGKEVIEVDGADFRRHADTFECRVGVSWSREVQTRRGEHLNVQGIALVNSSRGITAGSKRAGGVIGQYWRQQQNTQLSWEIFGGQ